MVQQMFKEVVSPHLPMGWTTKLVAGALIAAIFAWSGQWVGSVNGAITKANSIEVQQKEQHIAIDARIGDMAGSLDRIEMKLDKMIEREVARGK